MTNTLVFLSKENTPLTTTAIIAENLGYRANDVLKLCEKYLDDLKAFGSLPFKTVMIKAGKGATREAKIAYLNEAQATLLICYMRNSEKVRKFKVALVKAFYEMRTALQEQEKEKKALAVAREERHEERALDNAGFEFHKQKEIVAREYARVHAETAEMLDWWNEKESELEKAAGNLRALAALMQDEMGKTARLLNLMAGRKACTRAALSGRMKAMERREKQIAERENKALFHCFAFKS